MNITNKKLDFEIGEEDFQGLTDVIAKKLKNEGTVDFSDIINTYQSSRRELFLGDIVEGTGIAIDSAIRFWNSIDDEAGIPIEDRKPIRIYIDSMGGFLTDTLTMIDSIKNSKTPVWTIAVGCTYSGGFFTFIAGHKRLAYKHASFLYHEGSTGTNGTSSQFQNYAAFYKKQLETLKEITLTNTKISEEEYRDMHKDDIWYTSEEALEKGIVDEII